MKTKRDNIIIKRKSDTRRLLSSHMSMVLLLILFFDIHISGAFPILPVHAIKSPTTALQSTSSSAAAASTKDIKSNNKRTWKDGEYGSSLSKKLFFTYADPLLDIASTRQLETSDAFNVPEENLMKRAVTNLENIYDKCKEKAKSKIHGSSSLEDRKAISETKILTMALLQSQKSTLVLTGVLRLLNTIIQAFPAILIARLLRQIEAGNSISYMKPLQSALLLVSILSTKMIVENQYFHNVVKCATEVRGSVSGMIFDKSLRLSSSSLGQYISSSKEKNKKKESLGSGGVLNLMQSDATNIEFLTLQLHTIWDGLLQIAIYITLLYKYLGPSTLKGLAVLLGTIPINAMILRKLNRLNRQEMLSKDARMKKTTESVANMQLLKLQSWEDIFAKDVQTQREEELARHKKRGLVRALNQAISNAVPTVTLVVTLAAYAKTGKPIVASTIFTAISLFNQLRFPLFFYPMLIDSLANGRNSLKRISSYMAQKEITPYVEYMPKLEDGGGSIEMTNGNFLWSTGSTTVGDENKDEQVKEAGGGVPALSDASLYVKPGEIVAVVGEVGQGKSALVKSLIGELSPIPTVNGNQTDMPKVVAHGSIAYCSQEAWLPKGTIRESVVFGRELDEVKYQQAICTAGLDRDIAPIQMSAELAETKGLLTHDTDVGEDGSNLSGGQRARVALARALYEESAGVYILDDPLSALDASVGSMVFERVSAKLRREKAATIFVTNDPNLPRRCDRVILMGKSDTGEGSKILDIETYDDLISRGHNLQTIVYHGDTEEDSADTLDGDVLHTEDMDGLHEVDSICQVQLPSTARTENVTALDCHADPDSRTALKQDPSLLAEHVVPKPIEPIQKEKPLSADDSMSTTAVPRSTYLKYFKAVKSPLLVLAALSAYFVSNGSQFMQQLIVSKWTDGAITAAATSKYLSQLVVAAIMVSVSMYFRSYLTMSVGVRASKTLHQDMLKSVFNAPLSFFSATPSGQLLSRFSRELEVVDKSLPDGIASVLYCFLQIFFSTLALAGAVTPAMIVPISLVGIIYVKTMGKFRPAARDLKRGESKTRSPIYTHFREALRGSEIIRTIPNGKRIWSTKHYSLADENIRTYYTVKSLDRWLSVRLESLGNTVVLTAAAASIFLSRAGKLKSGSAGWGLTQALSITGLLTWAVRVLTDLETQFMSVMRVNELSNLESTDDVALSEEVQPLLPRIHSDTGEAMKTIELSTVSTHQPAQPNEAELLYSGWPWKGHVKFNNVSMRYNKSTPLVLKNVSLDIPAGSTLGVVGRTGSGKSSLLLTLFRLVEVEGTGSITIDGVDIRSLSLKGLRDSLSIIPQSPTLFAGTLLYNLDASGKVSQEEAWSALESAGVARQFRESELGLNTMISEGGENLSLGQRQLICLARALIKRSKILVLDEATSSVDTNTDAQVQETIKREFVNKGVTVITVAHRLDTVLGYDKILVLDAGEPVEFGQPDHLLKLPRGYLRRLFNADRRNRQRGGQQQVPMPI